MSGISLRSPTDLHLFRGETLIGVRQWYEVLDSYVRPFAGSIGNDFIVRNNNASANRDIVVKDYNKCHGLERMEWRTHLTHLYSIEHLRQLCAIMAHEP